MSGRPNLAAASCSVGKGMESKHPFMSARKEWRSIPFLSFA